MSNTEEIETEVKDFDKTKSIISKILGEGNYILLSIYLQLNKLILGSVVFEENHLHWDLYLMQSCANAP